MDYQHNVFFGLTVLPFDIILYVFLFIRKKQQTYQSFRFRLLVLSIIIMNIADIACMLTMSSDTALPVPIYYITHSADIFFSTFASYELVTYVHSHVKDERFRRVGTLVNRIVLAGMMLLLVFNSFTDCIFSYDVDGNMSRGYLYAVLTYILPACYVAHGIFILTVKHDDFESNQKTALIAAYIIINGIFTVQVILFNSSMLTSTAATVAVYIIFLILESVDNKRVKDMMAQLEKARADEANAKNEAIAASEAKTKFLTQMSHEIRTPVNAILGYNDLIMDDTDEPSTRENARKAKLAARRLLDFFESIFDFISEEDGEAEPPSADDISAEPDEEEKPERRTVPPENLRILVVDDTDMNVDLMTRILRSMGFQTDTAADGEKAVEKIRNGSYDLVFMDHMMPVMDGIEAFRTIRREKLCPETPVIMVTANTVKGEREKYLKEGFAEYVEKPFNDASIREVVLKELPVDGEQLDRAGWSEEWRGIQKTLPFLRISAAKEYCVSDLSLYTELLKSFVVDNELARLEEALESGDYYTYRALVRALRDISALIGADRLCEKGAAIERCYLKGSLDDIKIKHVALFEETKKIIKQISEALFVNDSDIGAASLDNVGSLDTRPLVLVIDDDATDCAAIESILSKHFRVKCAMSGEEGIIKVQDMNPAVVLLDIRMTSMDGFTVFRALRTVEETADIPVVFITADDHYDSEIHSFRAGADDFIRKPFEIMTLIKRVSRIVELSSLKKHLRHEILRQTEKVALLSREVMFALAKAVDAKDHYTHDHSQRVAKYSAEIAKQLGKSKAEQHDLFVLGLLHDVGKIGIDEDIINKPDRLTDEEFEHIKQHTVIGYDILKIITEMPEAAKAARWHHERYDGRGYPDGLAAADIPEAARIICVADSYDAMTSLRPYRTVRPQAEVRKELLRCKGTQFDPLIADAMIRIIDADKDYTLHE